MHQWRVFNAARNASPPATGVCTTPNHLPNFWLVRAFPLEPNKIPIAHQAPEIAGHHL